LEIAQKPNPLLSILVLCFNHEAYIDEALESIQQIKHQPIEVLICDDFSLDKSVEILKKWQNKRPDWNFQFNLENLGNCKTFNSLLAVANGKYVIDFAADDVFVPHNIQTWIRRFETNPNAGFCYADASVFDNENGKEYLFSQKVKREKMPEGWILNELLGIPFICPPAVMFKRSALEKVGGYNENLAYEDLDIWLRMARSFEVIYYDAAVVRYRKHRNSLSASLFLKRNKNLLQSTLAILNQILAWKEFENGSPELVVFIKYHLKISSAMQLREEAKAFYNLLSGLKKIGFQDKFWMVVAESKMPFWRIFAWLKSGN